MVFIVRMLQMPVELCKFRCKILSDFFFFKLSIINIVRLMNIETLQWDTHLCNFFGVSKKLLPEIRSSSEVYGVFADGPLKVGSIYIISSYRVQNERIVATFWLFSNIFFIARQTCYQNQVPGSAWNPEPISVCLIRFAFGWFIQIVKEWEDMQTIANELHDLRPLLLTFSVW